MIATPRRRGAARSTGRTLDYTDQPNRKTASLYLSLTSKFGVELGRLGDSKERLVAI
ncbi:MAG: hypothetical protein MK538_13185 [Planctomycetes bacterium]|nr:hypothetical protein [Planctomycetota bacterium]